jgi:hypothetical protein
MYPDFLHALARQHQAELLRHQRFKQTEDTVRPRGRPRGPTPWQRTRHSLGTALVIAGTRLRGGAPGGVEFFDSRG